MALIRFALKRLAVSAGLLLAVSFLIFGLLQLAPGSVLTTLLGGEDASEEQIAALTR